MPGIHPPDDAIPESDVRAIVRLLAETAVAGNTIPQKKRALAQGLAALVGADDWVWVVSKVGEDTLPAFINLLHSEMPPPAVAMIAASSQDTTMVAPEHDALLRELSGGAHFTRTRPQMVPDDAWHASEQVRHYRHPHGIDEFLYSVMPLTDTLFSGMAFYRRPGREPFNPRERRLAHIVMTETSALHEAGIPELDAGERLPDLSPRQRTVFALLLEGWGRRQIAEHLAISPHTVADHMKAIYRHFGVGTQRELIRRFMVGNGQDVPVEPAVHAG